MEYIEGEDIASFINDYCAPLTPITLDDIFIQLIDAFCYIEAHGIIHRDIREGNILIEKGGTVKVIDFGIGKIFKKSEEVTDSLVGEINRAASDTLPQEYNDGVYTSSTDMFYLAELLHRLMRDSDACDEKDFSYWDILRKMMEKRAENRFPSFSVVRDAIGKHDFVNMPISERDKKIYQEFTNYVSQAIASYIEEPRFITDVTSFITKLNSALSNNLFESIIQNNAEIIRCVVVSGFRYNKGVDIPVKTVRNFADWFQVTSPQSQTLVLNNFISKLSSIRIEEPAPELPF